MLDQSLFWHNDGIFQEMDAGVICIDKSRPGIFMSLVVAAWMNTKEVREEITYKYVHGDAETYWLSAELTHTPYHFHPSYASAIGSPLPLDPSKICGSHSLHLDSQQKPLWISGGSQRQNHPDNLALRLYNFAHWMSLNGSKTATKPTTLSDQISWKPAQDTNSTYCASGAQPLPLSGSEYWDLLQEISEEARMVEMEYSHLRNISP